MLSVSIFWWMVMTASRIRSGCLVRAWKGYARCPWQHNRLQNSVRLVKGLQLEVEEIVFNGLASSLALLTSEQKELGALVIDIGGGTTDYVVYSDGVIKHTGVLAVGGDHVQ